MSTGTSEFEQFGPWVDQVTTVEQIPRLFRDAVEEVRAARLVLKVPRPLARRDATADMDLYDHLLVLGDAGLTVLSRRTAPGDQGYERRTVPYADVVAVHDVVDLLDAHLTIHPRQGPPLTVPYNGSARGAVESLLEGLREATVSDVVRPVGRALVAVGIERATQLAAHDLPDDLTLVSDLADAARRRPSLAPWGWHGRTRVTRRRLGWRGVATHLADTARPLVLQAGVIAGDTSTLEIHGRHRWVLPRATSVLSASRLLVPVDAPDTLTLAEHPDLDDIVVANLTAGQAHLEVLAPVGSRTHDVLTQVADLARENVGGWR